METPSNLRKESGVEILLYIAAFSWTTSVVVCTRFLYPGQTLELAFARQKVNLLRLRRDMQSVSKRGGNTRQIVSHLGKLSLLIHFVVSRNAGEK